ncbi:VWA domain-containing protein [bacterium]|nr:VWA domain-containing protein [bacterium]NDD82909.1 VWA domain-containing protein [bacterium]NDG29601.1 VWA domain-containing protein [bacterium]
MATRAYAIAGFNSIFVSDDLGVTWNQATAAGLNTSPFNIGSTRVWIDTDKHNPYKSLVANQVYGIYRSVDGGESYILSGNTSGYNWHSVYYIDSTTVIALGDQLFKSTDGGQNFVALPTTPAILYGSSGVVARACYFVNTSTGFIAVEDKVYRTFNGGTTWEPLNNDTAIVAGYQITGIVSDGLGENITIVCGAGVYSSADYGLTFSLLGTPGALGGSTTADFRFSRAFGQPGVVYLICDLGIYKSSNSGITWTLVNGSATGTDNVDIYDFGSNRLIIALDTDLYSSADGGVTLDNAFVAGKLTDVTGTEFTCGTCPSKYTFNPVTGLCEQAIEGLSLCGEGYTYNPSTGLCEVLGDDPCEIDLIITMDNSTSVTNEEFNELKLLAEGIVNNLSAQINAGDIQVGVVQWSNSATLTQDLTSNLVDIIAAINLPRISGGTDHVDAMCVAETELFTGVNARSLADKAVITLTDGIGCDGPCVYNTVTYNALAGYIDLCTALKADGVKLIMVGLGTPGDVSSIYNSFINIANPVVSLDNGNLLWFESQFTGASSIAQAVSDSVCAQAYTPVPCSDGCTLTTGVDPDDSSRLIARCSCITTLDIVLCCYELTDCKGSAESIITQTDLSSVVTAGQIIKIQGSDVCWSVQLLDDICPVNTPVVVTEIFTECFVCEPSYSLYNCKDNSVVIYTTQDFSASIGKTIELVEYPKECWLVGPNTKAEFVPEDVTLATEFQTCAICNPPIYQLNNCFNDQSFILTDSDLLTLVGKTISIQGYPGLCFTVTEPTCKCLRVTGIFDIETGIEETIDVTASTVLVNGRYQYLFTANGDNYSIVWNSTDNQWEFYNVTTSTLLAYSPIDIACPYTSYWVPVLQEITYVYTLQDGSTVTGAFQSVYVSTDFGQTYTLYFDGIPVSTSNASVIEADQTTIGSVFVAGDLGIYHTSDHGFSWSPVGGSYTTGGAFNDILVNNGTTTPFTLVVGDTFAASTDGGVSFSDLADSPATLYPTWGPSPQAHAVDSWDLINIYVGVEDKLFKSTDLGATWTACNSNNPISIGNTIQDVVTSNYTTVIVITTVGIFRSSDNGTSFSQTLVITENVIGAGCSLSSSNIIDVVYYPATLGETGGIYRSTNSGNSWTLQSTITGGSASTAGIFSIQQNMATVGRSDDAYYSTNSGVTKAVSSLPGKPTSITGTFEYTSCEPFCSSLITTESCLDLIYDINVDQVYPDCECCTTKNCK